MQINDIKINFCRINNRLIIYLSALNYRISIVYEYSGFQERQEFYTSKVFESSFLRFWFAEVNYIILSEHHELKKSKKE